MQFKTGEKVFHPIHGIGNVIAINEMAVNGEPPREYYEVTFFKTRLWVLVDPDEAGRLRPITPRSEIARYQILLKSRSMPIYSNYRLHQNDMITRFKTGTLEALCEIVRDLSKRKTFKSLSEFDSVMLSRASEYLYDEWALINDVTRKDAIREVDALLVEGQSQI